MNLILFSKIPFFIWGSNNLRTLEETNFTLSFDIGKGLENMDGFHFYMDRTIDTYYKRGLALLLQEHFTSTFLAVGEVRGPINVFNEGDEV